MLKLFGLNKKAQKKAALAFIMFALLICLSCGKRTPPLPPLERVSQRVEISGFQRGNKVNLTWTMPARNASDGSILNIDRADIYRLAEPLKSALTLSEEEFASRSTLIATLPLTDADFGLKQISYTDTLEFAGQPVRLRYALRFVNASGQKAAFSNFLLIEPTAKIADIPTSLLAKITEPAIILDWNEPEMNVDGSKPANILGYNVYRSPAEKEKARILNETPVTRTEFADQSFEFGKDYFYFARTVSLGSNGEPVESLESNIVKISPKDVFPPGPPGAITIAAAPNNLSIFFATNPEKDIAGYRVYRSTDKNLPLSEWQNLTPELLTTSTFQDAKVESGKTYFYYLTATDTTGNTGEPSEIVSETAP
ncbi:MAG: fibronectin type III domain-containing protein [Pyrinomonadaceae bacterium]